MTKDYKDTLNLPQTEFPMRGNLAKREPDMLKRWQSIDVYSRMQEKHQTSEKVFILHDGPPYANGDIHSGHAVNKILKDIVIKSKSLSGYRAPFIPGWDCHGLPIEVQVEKKLGKAGRDIDAAEFRRACRNYAQSQVDQQRSDFIRLGVFADWQHPYLTMDYAYEADIVRALGKIIANGHLERGFKPVYWSVAGGSALAEAEVEYHEKTSTTVDVRFRPIDIQSLLEAFHYVDDALPVSIVIWTTTPWTLPANQAVSLNAALDYALVRCDVGAGYELLIIATDLVGSTMERYGVDTHDIVSQCKGAQLEHMQLQHPFYDRTVPVILGDHVTTETGTGAVHTAPDHGLDDFYAGNRYHLPTLNLVNDRGIYREDVPLLAGQHVHKVDPQIIELLEQHGNLVRAGKITHSFPHCWRTKCPLIFRATPQWFISMHRKNLLQAVNREVDKVQWLPHWGRARIVSMLESSPDWCISRQRTWGVPIPLFIHRKTQNLHPQTAGLIAQVADKIEQHGIQAWFDLEPEQLLGEDAQHYDKISDTLDVWFDSGVTHEAVLQRRAELAYPADLYLEGSDQHRGWFQSSLKTAVAINGSAPYRTVLTHGFTVDAQGKKMSKSLGNTVPPQKICDTLGADILRLWVAATDFSGEMSVSEEILKRIADSYRRIRNTLRFLLANLNNFDPAKDSLPAHEMVQLDQWLVSKTRQLQDRIITQYDRYEFHQIYQLIHNFCIVDLGGFYLDIIKDRQYTTPADSHARRSTQTAMYHVSEALTRWLAPILSFTADEVWQALPGARDDTVFVSTWYQDLHSLDDNAHMNHDFWDSVIDVRTAVQKKLEDLRASDRIGSSLDAEVDIYCDDDLFEQLSGLEDELRFVLITSYARIHRKQNSDVNEEDQATSPMGRDLWISAGKSAHKKCVRCWHLREEVGSHAEHPGLCNRCIENLVMPGETRRYV